MDRENRFRSFAKAVALFLVLVAGVLIQDKKLMTAFRPAQKERNLYSAKTTATTKESTVVKTGTSPVLVVTPK